MAIKLKRQAKKNPQTKEVKYYAQVAPQDPVDFDYVAELIETESTVSETDVKAVLASLQRVIIRELQQGRIVRLGDLGSFRLTVSATGCPAKSMVTAETVRDIHVHFNQSARMMKEMTLQNVKFQMVDDGEEETAS